MNQTDMQERQRNRLARLRRRLRTVRQDMARLEQVGGLTHSAAASVVARVYEQAAVEHARAGVCLGCAVILDEPMTGYTTHCVVCGATHVHPTNEATS